MLSSHCPLFPGPLSLRWSPDGDPMSSLYLLYIATDPPHLFWVNAHSKEHAEHITSEILRSLHIITTKYSLIPAPCSIPVGLPGQYVEIHL